MSEPNSRRGGAPVGYLSELEQLECHTVLYFRLWFENQETQTQVKRDFETALDPEHGQQMCDLFGALCDMCVRHGRRPLMRHHVACKCLGADESCFANFIGYASEGARADALMIATTLVKPEMAPLLAGLAEEVGLGLRKLSLRHRAPKTSAPVSVTIH